MVACCCCGGGGGGGWEAWGGGEVLSKLVPLLLCPQADRERWTDHKAEEIICLGGAPTRLYTRRQPWSPAFAVSLRREHS